MDFQLTEQQRRMVAAVRDLAQGEFKANAQKYMDGTFPWENMRKLADIGVLGMSVPEEYGGLGLPVFDTALVLEEIAKTCYVTAMATLGEAGVQTRVISTYAPDAIRERIGFTSWPAGPSLIAAATPLSWFSEPAQAESARCSSAMSHTGYCSPRSA